VKPIPSFRTTVLLAEEARKRARTERIFQLLESRDASWSTLASHAARLGRSFVRGAA